MDNYSYYNLTLFINDIVMSATNLNGNMLELYANMPAHKSFRTAMIYGSNIDRTAELAAVESGALMDLHKIMFNPDNEDSLYSVYNLAEVTFDAPLNNESNNKIRLEVIELANRYKIPVMQLVQALCARAYSPDYAPKGMPANFAETCLYIGSLFLQAGEA